jgi:hypothetical protein
VAGIEGWVKKIFRAGMMNISAQAEKFHWNLPNQFDLPARIISAKQTDQKQ